MSPRNLPSVTSYSGREGLFESSVGVVHDLCRASVFTGLEEGSGPSSVVRASARYASALDSLPSIRSPVFSEKVVGIEQRYRLVEYVSKERAPRIQPLFELVFSKPLPRKDPLRTAFQSCLYDYVFAERIVSLARSKVTAAGYDVEQIDVAPFLGGAPRNGTVDDDESRLGPVRR